VQLTRLLDTDASKQHPDTMKCACEAVWHLSFHSVGKARLCESSVLVQRLKELALHDDPGINDMARGALFGMGIIPRPLFSDSMSHIFLSFDAPQRHRVSQIADHLVDYGYLVWMDPPEGQMEEQFLQGVINSAVVCVCLSSTLYTTARARTEFTLAYAVSKFVVLLVIDDEGREDSWMNPLMRGRITIDFAIPGSDSDNIKDLVAIFEKNFGKRGKQVIKPKDDHSSHESTPRDQQKTQNRNGPPDEPVSSPVPSSFQTSQFSQESQRPPSDISPTRGTNRLFGCIKLPF